MSNSETHTVSMPPDFWVGIDEIASNEHSTRSAIIQDSVKAKLSANDDKGRRYRLFDIVFMLLLFVIILLLVMVIT